MPDLLDRSPNRLQAVSRELLATLADCGGPMTVDEVVTEGGLDADQVARQLSVARIAGFVRALPGTSGTEPLYAPTPLGMAVAGRGVGRFRMASAL